MPSELFLLSYPFERLVIGLLVQELSGFFVPLHPLLNFRIEDLGSVPNRPFSLIIAFRWIRRHIPHPLSPIESG